MGSVEDRRSETAALARGSFYSISVDCLINVSYAFLMRDETPWDLLKNRLQDGRLHQRGIRLKCK